MVKERLEASENTKVIRKAVRKTAHVLEYLTLGLLAASFLGPGVSLWDRVRRLLLMGGGIALVDETIQIFSKRTSSVTDIWIDLGGFAAGCLLILLIELRKQHRAKA